MRAPVKNRYVDVIGFRGQNDTTNQLIPVPYIKLKDVPCSIESVTGGEVRRGQQIQATVNKLVTMNFQDQYPITTGDELHEMHGKAVHQKIGVVAAYDPDGGRRVLLVQGKTDG